MSTHQHNRGATLLITLIMLSVCMLLGTASANLSQINQKAARNGRDHEMALQAAEAALHDALLDLKRWRGSTRHFPEQAGCTTTGLCLSDGAALWRRVDLATTSTAYGDITGRIFPHGSGSMAAQTPRYLIELLRLPITRPNTENKTLLRYRITAIGYGPRQHSQVLLQTIHAVSADDSGILQTGRRLSWREIVDLKP